MDMMNPNHMPNVVSPVANQPVQTQAYAYPYAKPNMPPVVAPMQMGQHHHHHHGYNEVAALLVLFILLVIIARKPMIGGKC